MPYLSSMDCNLCWLCLGSPPARSADTDLDVMAERRQKREQPLQSKLLEMTLQHSRNVGLRNPELLCNFCLRQPELLDATGNASYQISPKRVLLGISNP